MSPSHTHLYVVEDDNALRQMICAYLQGQGFGVTGMSNAEELLSRIPRLRPDLVLLDIGLPGMDGLRACQLVRASEPSLPIIMVTGRCDAVERVIGLEMGADDFVGKPYVAREIFARVKAVLRRVPSTPPGGEVKVPQEFFIAGNRRFVPAMRGISLNDRMVQVGQVECRILTELVVNADCALSREHLRAASCATAPGRSYRSVDTAVFRLRRLLETDASNPQFIRSVRGVGYVYASRPLPG